MAITLETGKTVPQIHQVKEDPHVTTLKTKFKKLFNEIHAVNRLEVRIKLIEDAILINRKKHPYRSIYNNGWKKKQRN